MSEEARHITTDLAIIGTGLAGFAASVFALKRNINTVQIGNTGAVAYTTGYLDLLGAICGDESETPEAPETSAQSLTDPWKGIERLRVSQPNHPLCKVAKEDIHLAFKQVVDFLRECGINYTQPGAENVTALTPAGTLKQTFCVPSTMEAGVSALLHKNPCVIVDFNRLKGFSGKQVIANLQDKWPALTTARVEFPETIVGEIYPEVIARCLEVAATREKLAKILIEAAGDAKIVGMPAILGIHGPDKVREELERLTGLEIFEIPTMPPSVPGIRLREMFEQKFPQKGLTLVPQQKVTTLKFSNGIAELSLHDNYGPITVSAKNVILATGRFLSGGLEVHFDGIVEPLLDIPVTQPKSRSEWYREKYTDSRGHKINKSGIEVDHAFRPLTKNATVVSEHLFAAGAILANQDWIRGRCGAGIAIATAYKAVEEAAKLIKTDGQMTTEESHG